MTALTELSRRVSEAEGPSRELDGEVHFYLRGGMPTFSRGEFLTGPRYTASLDAVVALIAEKLPGHDQGSETQGLAAYGFVWERGMKDETLMHAEGKTEINARLAAALLAIHERNKSYDKA